MTQEYKTNLTEQQYRSQEGRLEAYKKLLHNKFINDEITKDEASKNIFEYAKKLGLLVIYNKSKQTEIMSAREIFGSDSEKKQITRFEEKKYYEKIPELEVPKQFFTAGDRNAPCKIVQNPNVKKQILGSVEYSNTARREVDYTLCETPKGVRVSSPSFGSHDAVSRRKEETWNKCPHEFGKKSKEIGEFHTHPGIGYSEFSVQDLASFTWRDTSENLGDSRCVVSKVKNKKGKEKIRVRCTTSRDTVRYLDAIKFKGMDMKYKGLPNILYNRDAQEKLGDRFRRDPDMQNAFTCTVDIAEKSTKSKTKVQKNGYEKEYNGKIVSYKKEVPTKKLSKQLPKKPKPKIKSSEEFLGLGAYL